MNGDAELIKGRRHVCYICTRTFVLMQDRRNFQVIRKQSSLKIRTLPTKIGPQRVCLSYVPIDECIFVCFSCWMEHQDGELADYAQAVFAGEIYSTEGHKIG